MLISSIRAFIKYASFLFPFLIIFASLFFMTTIANKKPVKRHAYTVLPEGHCYCGVDTREITVKKEGPNTGRKATVCDVKLYNALDNTNYGGCDWFYFVGDPMMICEDCARPMKHYKGLLSSARCVNMDCKSYRTLDDLEAVRIKVLNVLGNQQCDCGEDWGCSTKGKLTAVVYCKTKKCNYKKGIDLVGSKVYF